MKTFSRILISFLAIGAFVAVAGFSGPASAQSKCKAFPKVAWWGKMSHDRVIRYVNRKYKGDWKRYIVKWKRQLRTMVDINDRGSVAIVQKRGIKLKGKKLLKYIDDIDKRIAVTKCLAGEAAKQNRKAKPGRG